MRCSCDNNRGEPVGCAILHKSTQTRHSGYRLRAIHQSPSLLGRCSEAVATKAHDPIASVCQWSMVDVTD